MNIFKKLILNHEYGKNGFNLRGCWGKSYWKSNVRRKREIGSGLTIEDLNLLKVYFESLGFVCELIDLGCILDKVAKEGKTGEIMDWGFPAGVLIIRRFIEKETRLKVIPWDRKYWDTRRKKVLNKMPEQI